MKVIYIASEGAPFAASGGLGDVMGALPHAVAEVGGGKVETEVILPLYGSMKEEYRARLVKEADIRFAYGWRQTGASVFSLTEGGVLYHFIENHYYFNRQRLYGEPDDGERFAFFSMAALEFMLATGDIPDVLHANDWQTAMAVIYLKTEYAHIEAFRRIRTVFTIHNIEYQGKFDPYILGDIFALDAKYYHIVEYEGCINLMKGALTVSDYISTVSPNYACELRHDFFAFGLADIIAKVSDKMCGVINGIDYTVFSPERGGGIYRPYGREDLDEGKRANKTALQRELGLAEEPDTPLVVMITRLTAGKGVELVLRILDELLGEKMQFVILGTGEAIYESAFSAVASRHPNMRALIRFDRNLSKKMYAAADIFLMPSKSEPCGLAQMIACSYGTVPVVRAVGGLYDSIKPYGSEGANGFTFNNFNAHELLFTLKWALELYRDTSVWAPLRLAAKDSDFSWDKSAKKYLSLYQNITNW
mgnify:FL=1